MKTVEFFLLQCRQKPVKKFRILVFGNQGSPLEKLSDPLQDMPLSLDVVFRKIRSDEKVVVLYSMPLKEEAIKRLSAFRAICEDYILFFIEEGAKHNKPVGDRFFDQILEGFFHTEHVLAEAAARALIIDSLFRYCELIAP